MRASRFNPHAMSDEAVKALATGREDVLAQILGVIEANRSGGGSLQHVLIAAPRGMGKSFLLRLVQVALQERTGSPRFVLLPEEQPNITTPASFLDEIRRTLEGGDPGGAMPRFAEEGPGAWDEAAARLEAAIRAAMPDDPHPLLVAAVENLDVLLDSVFRGKANQSRLRKLLAGQPHLMLLATTLKGDLDQGYDARLFHAFAHKRLRPWEQADYMAYFRRRRAGTKDAAHPGESRLKAIATFTGGSPRMAVVLADLVEEGDPLSAAGTLDRLVDELTPYYQDLLERMPPRSRALFDALVRGGEPCSQSDLAARVGTTQNRIAQHFAWLRENEVVFGERRQGGRDFLYRIADRVFVQYYRKRFILHGGNYTPLAAMTDFLATFFSADENRTRALDLLKQGAEREAQVFMRVALEQERPELAGSADFFTSSGLLQGFILQDANRHEEAFDAFERAAARAEEEGDKGRQALCLYIMGESFRQLGRHEEAVDALSRSAFLAKKTNLKSIQRSCLLLKGWSLGHLGRYETAVDTLDQATILADEEGNKISKATCLRLIGTNLIQLNCAETAIEVLSRAVTLAKEAGDGAEQARCFLNMGIGLGQLGRHEEAIDILYRAEALVEEVGDKRTKAVCLHLLALSLGQLERLEETLSYYLSASCIFADLKYYKWQASSLAGACHYAVILDRANICKEAVREVRDFSLIERQLPEELAAALAYVEQHEGRAEAFARGQQILRWWSEPSLSFDAHPMLRGLFAGLVHEEVSPGLLRDLTEEMQADFATLPAPDRQAMSLTLDYLESGRDEAVLQRADPDIAAAVRTITSGTAREEQPPAAPAATPKPARKKR
ncbi:tetratricopeptide repeat protein [Marinimicrococcus flavescens]|uniref:Tetratricopeptide repeat protein n=1 Tax=Marinimicrococcus flavescens TaxID=3031815 RepID=A0AAP3V1D0_9PROT|nr:tetratricopeptide repeat protein [Marinimicrococcus flavescens]